MDKELMLIENFFQGKQVRTVWSKEEEKFYVSVVDIEGMFRLIESIPSKKAEPVKLWLA
jgi:hypothetical protein